MNIPSIKVMLVDDHPMVQDGLSACLSFYDDIQIVGTCNDGSQALSTAQACQPDVILMDISMPTLNGLDATEIITEVLTDTKILIFSMHESAEFVTNAVQSGASGYILKDTNSEEVYQAIKSVAQGKAYFSSSIAKMLIDNPPTQASPRLTAREQMILSYIAKGQSSKAIAQTLDISFRTVEAHRRNIKSKLNIDSLAELVRYAVNQGLVDS
ncbi:MAG: response regulator transcription factor [Glaciecola sp.]|jgi:two-component system NarL family response regulator|nr:response regulator transcription factor [Glaciecola sp.]MDG1816056.1 response regulator transcription factor [Glaciecola sp.]MDG2098316.1 response regulator transcription factor [Glaciecola sp.]